MKAFPFEGETYSPAFDKTRLQTQLGRVYSLMIDGVWRTLEEISQEVPGSITALSARLRDFRKIGFIVESRRRGEASKGIWEYRVLRPLSGKQLDFFAA